MPHNPSVSITYFSDILCVWAYAAQVRLNEISKHFGAEVQIEYKFCSIFGNSVGKIAQGWADKGMYGGFNAHLQEIGKKFKHIYIHPDIWFSTRPASSDSAHLLVKAVQILEERNEHDRSVIGDIPLSTQLIWQLRRAFFRECRDVAQRDVQYEIVEGLGIPVASVQTEIDNGSAFASLAADYREQDRLKIEGSPTFVLNQGRQKLFGNVGYRVIEANVRELLREPAVGEMSWC